MSPGTYALRASAVGYAPVTVNDVKVQVDQTTRIPFSLRSEAVEMGDVLVTANTPDCAEGFDLHNRFGDGGRNCRASS